MYKMRDLVLVSYIRNIIPTDMRIPSPAVLALSGRGYALFGAAGVPKIKESGSSSGYKQDQEITSG